MVTLLPTFVAVLSLSIMSVRRFDVFTLALMSALVYFFPCFDPRVDFEHVLYGFYSLFFIGVVVAAFVSDVLVRGATSRTAAFRFESGGGGKRGVLLGGVIVSMFLAIRTDGLSSYFQYKVLSTQEGGIYQYAWVTFAAFLWLYSLETRWSPGMLVSGGSYLFFLLTGDRTHLAIALLSFALFKSVSGRFSLIDLRGLGAKRALLVSAALAGVFYGKHVYGAAADAYAGANFVDALVARYDGKGFSEQLESYHTQLLLDLVVRDDLSIPSDYLLDLPLQILPFYGESTGSTHYHSNILKDLYFSGWLEKAGVSSNIWAEGFTAFGWVGVALFFLVYCSGLHLFRVGLSRLHGIPLYAACVAGAFWAGYILASARVGRLVPGTGGLAVALLFGTLVILPLGIGGVTAVLDRPAILLGGLVVAVLSSLLPYGLELHALRRLPTRVFGILMSLQPAAGALAGLVLIGQRLAPHELVALALVSVASAGATTTSRLREPPPPASPETGVAGEPSHGHPAGSTAPPGGVVTREGREDDT
jgi:hypothetical protein